MSEPDMAGSPIGALPGWRRSPRGVVLARCELTQVEVLPRAAGLVMIVRVDGQDRLALPLSAEAARVLAEALLAG